MENQDKKNIVLACDVSTACIGICLLWDDGSDYGKVIELTHITPKASKKNINKTEELFLKKKCFEEYIVQFKDYGITKVVIEEPLLSSNNQNTVATLLRFNGMVSDCIYNVLGVVPDYISSYDARKFSFPELMSVRVFGKDEKRYPNNKIINNIKKSNYVLFGGYPWTIDKKFVIHSKVKELFPNIEWQYNKKGELKKENFDATDAYVAAISQIHKEKYGDIQFTTDNIQIVDTPYSITYDVHYWDKTEHRKTFLATAAEQDEATK